MTSQGRVGTMRRQVALPFPARILVAAGGIALLLVVTFLALRQGGDHPFTGTIVLGHNPGPLWIDRQRGRVLVINQGRCDGQHARCPA